MLLLTTLLLPLVLPLPLRLLPQMLLMLPHRLLLLLPLLLLLLLPLLLLLSCFMKAYPRGFGEGLANLYKRHLTAIQKSAAAMRERAHRRRPCANLCYLGRH